MTDAFDLFNKINALESKTDCSISLVASESLLYPHIHNCLQSITHQLTLEGDLRKRYFPTPEEINEIEYYAQQQFQNLFGQDNCDLRSTTATHANISVLLSVLQPGDTILAMDLASGGHLSHCHPKSIAGRLYNILTYSTDALGQINVNKVEELIDRNRPKLVISGGSSYPRIIPHDVIGEIAHNFGAIHLADISHTAGLMAASVIPKNLEYADIVTLGTQKTFLGPRGGVILCRDEFRKSITESVFPGLEGAMIIPQILAKAVAVEFAQTTEFQRTQKRILHLSKALSSSLQRAGVTVVTGGTDNHITLIEITNAQALVRTLSTLLIRCNANPIPNSQQWGIRFGTTSMAQSKISDEEAIHLFDLVATVCNNPDDRTYCWNLKQAVGEIIDNGWQRVSVIEEGNYIATGRISLRDYKTSQSLIRDRQKQPTFCVPMIQVLHNELQSLLDSTSCAVIIPTIGLNDQVNTTVSYIRTVLKHCCIYIIDSGFAENTIISLDQHTVRVPLHSITETLFHTSAMKEELGFNLRRHLGKGWGMYIGYIMSLINNKKHLFFIDDDLDNICSYNPLQKLVAAVATGCDHAMIATPKRRNEVIHGALNALQTQYRDDAGKAKSLIHFLAGERYIATRAFKDCPWLTNYGVETWLNLYSIHYNHDIVQVGNTQRRDAVNSYYKNEIMLMYSSRLLAIILDSEILDFTSSLIDIRRFNKRLDEEGDISILPLEPNRPIDTFRVNCDCLVPPFTILKKRYLRDSQIDILRL